MTLSPQSLRVLQALSIRTKRSFYGTRYGSHRSLRRGHGIEFAEYRNYEVGDNPRTIDWNLYGRSDKLYSKRFLEEENVVVYLVIDGSGSIMHPALREKWECAQCIALATSFVALASHDTVMLSILGGKTSQKFSGARSYHQIQAFLSSQEKSEYQATRGQVDLERQVQTLAARLSFPGICIFISDFLYPPEVLHGMLSNLRARNLEIHCVQVLGAIDSSPFGRGDGGACIDSETGELRGVAGSTQALERYSQLLNEHNEAVRSLCLSQGVTLVQASLDEKTDVEEVALNAVTAMGIFV